MVLGGYGKVCNTSIWVTFNRIQILVIVFLQIGVLYRLFQPLDIPLHTLKYIGIMLVSVILSCFYHIIIFFYNLLFHI